MGMCNKPIGSNPRKFMGFKNKASVTKHIKKYFPDLAPCVGKIKKLKGTYEMREKSGKHYEGYPFLVYFKVRKN